MIEIMAITTIEVRPSNVTNVEKWDTSPGNADLDSKVSRTPFNPNEVLLNRNEVFPTPKIMGEDFTLEEISTTLETRNGTMSLKLNPTLEMWNLKRRET